MLHLKIIQKALLRDIQNKDGTVEEVTEPVDLGSI